MKRLALAVASLLVGSGCIVTHDRTCDRTITINWSPGSFSGFTYSTDGGTTWFANAGCYSAGVANVDVFMDGAHVNNPASQSLPTAACTAGGIIITAVPDGSHTIDVEGLDSFGTILYRDSFTIDATSCGDHFVDSTPAEGYLDLAYHFTPPPDVCLGGGSYIWFSIYDQIAGSVTYQVGRNSSASDKILFPCGATTWPAATIIPLPAGAYTVQWVEEVAPGSYTVTASNCSPSNVNPFPGGTTTTDTVYLNTTSPTVCQ